MKKLFLTLATLLITAQIALAAPSNSINIPNSFTPNTTISSSEMNANFSEVSTKYAVHTHEDITKVGAITTGTWTATVIDGAYGGTGNVYGLGLPSGSVFFMITGSCPSGTTDVTATYADKFPRLNATPASTGGADSHTHTGPSHTHSMSGSSGTNTPTHATTTPSGSGTPGEAFADGVTTHTHSVGSLAGAAAGTGATGSGDNVPAYFTVKMCQVD